MAKNTKENPSEAHKDALRSGLLVFGMLALLTAGEFIVAVIAPPWSFILWIVALTKAFFVVRDYMHVGRLFGDEETH